MISCRFMCLFYLLYVNTMGCPWHFLSFFPIYMPRLGGVAYMYLIYFKLLSWTIDGCLLVKVWNCFFLRVPLMLNACFVTISMLVMFECISFIYLISIHAPLLIDNTVVTPYINCDIYLISLIPP